jgi:hypothetical protein
MRVPRIELREDYRAQQDKAPILFASRVYLPSKPLEQLRPILRLIKNHRRFPGHDLRPKGIEPRPLFRRLKIEVAPAQAARQGRFT